MRLPSLMLAPMIASALAATSAHAVIVLGNGDSVNLGTLLGSGSDRTVIIDDKIFHFDSFTSSAFDVSLFQVVGFVSATPNAYGLYNVGFDLIGPFGDGTPGNGLAHEMNLQYTVAVTPEAYARDVRLCDTGLVFNGSAGGPGSYARVDETVLDLDTNTFLGQLSAFDHAGLFSQLSDHKDFCQIYGNVHGWRAFEVNKDIKFFAATGQGFATASFIRQEFSQILAPSPGAVALVALAGVAVRRRQG